MFNGDILWRYSHRFTDVHRCSLGIFFRDIHRWSLEIFTGVLQEILRDVHCGYSLEIFADIHWRYSQMFTGNIHGKYSQEFHKIYALEIFTVDNHRRYSLEIHMGYSQAIYTGDIHRFSQEIDRCSQETITVDIHWGLTGDIHRIDSLKVFTDIRGKAERLCFLFSVSIGTIVEISRYCCCYFIFLF